MIKRNSGFTLMEIMVVIIIIAVLASVAGPMITSITDQGRTSATKSGLSNLKTALIQYKSDLGHYPHADNTMKYASNFAVCNQCGLGPSETNNCLVNDKITPAGAGAAGKWWNVGLSSANYLRRWKGPYMDADPADFMLDAWGNPIIYGVYKKTVYFQSAGADQEFDPVENIIGCKNYGTDALPGDDIVVAVARVRRAFNGAESAACGTTYEGTHE